MNKRRYAYAAALGFAMLLGPSAHAAESSPWYEKTKISGFADAYYKWNFNGIKSATSNTMDSGFDAHQNTFAVGGGKVEAATMDGMGVVDLYFGDYVLMQPAPNPAVSPNSVLVGQAYIKQSWGPVDVTLGRYATWLGYEVTDSVSNWNFSRGLLFNNVPFYHQGLKLTYNIVSGLSLMGSLDNGASHNYPVSNETGGGAQLAYTGMQGMGFFLNYYYEPTIAATAAAPFEKRHYIDVVANAGVMDSLDIAAEYLWVGYSSSTATDASGASVGTSQPGPAGGPATVPYDPKTQGYGIWLNWKTPMAGLSISPRFEQYFIPDGASTPGFTAPPGTDGGLTKFDYTLTARYVNGALTNWLELRTAAADDAIFALWPGQTNQPYSETALTWGAGYTF